VKPEAIVEKIRAALPDARVSLKDLTGTEDHWQAEIVSSMFAGLSLIARHRLVMAALVDEMKGPIHALTLDVKTPEEAAAAAAAGA
jgi:stress-induced morphogen